MIISPPLLSDRSLRNPYYYYYYYYCIVLYSMYIEYILSLDGVSRVIRSIIEKYQDTTPIVAVYICIIYIFLLENGRIPRAGRSEKQKENLISF